MEIVTKAKSETTLGMERANTSIQMAATTLETGLRAKCKALASYLTTKAIFSTKANGEMITLRVRASSTTTQETMTGSSMKASSEQEAKKGSERCFIKMVTDTRASSEIIFSGVRAGFSTKVGRS